MTRHTSFQAQRVRRTLNQEAMKRSHRRCDLIRLTPEDESAASLPQPVNATEQTDALDIKPSRP